MPKGESAGKLSKRLQKIERAQARLRDMTTRIRVQEETLAELLKLAQTFVSEKPTAPARRSAPKRAATTRRAPRKPTSS
jgi:hypothetical protein